MIYSYDSRSVQGTARAERSILCETNRDPLQKQRDFLVTISQAYEKVGTVTIVHSKNSGDIFCRKTIFYLILNEHELFEE